MKTSVSIEIENRRRWAIRVLAAIHVLGLIGAPIAASIHWRQENATDHQNFHVIWEACKYFTASLFALWMVLSPVAEGGAVGDSAIVVLAIGSAILFGGIFFADYFTNGCPPVDFYSYGPFLVISEVALYYLWQTRGVQQGGTASSSSARGAHSRDERA